MSSENKAPFTLVAAGDALFDLSQKAREAKAIALDTEADSLHHYYEKVCLIQISVDDSHCIIDPLAGLDLSELLSTIATKPLILHGADYDLRMLGSSFKFKPMKEVFDTMIAARILGYEAVGLVALVKRHFGAVLTKRGQKSDWSRRPLTREQLKYASDDTRYLRPLARILADELDRLSRTAWHRESCEEMVRSSAIPRPGMGDDGWRIKGAGLLAPRQMAFVREIWLWRETQAREADLPPFKILMNEQIISLAVRAASSGNSRIPDGVKLPRNCTGRRLDLLRAAIAKANSLPKSVWPARIRRERGERLPAGLIEALYNECRRISCELKIDTSLLATRADICITAGMRPASIEEMMASVPMMRWQADLLWPGFEKILSRHLEHHY